MATTQSRVAEQSAALESSELSSLLQKEFKPKTDQAREAVENAVRTLAEQALASSVTIKCRMIARMRLFATIVAGLGLRLRRGLLPSPHGTAAPLIKPFSTA